MCWEGQAAGAENVGINAEAENQALGDWGSGAVPIPNASSGRIGRAGRPPLGLGGQALASLFYKGERGTVLLHTRPPFPLLVAIFY